MIIFDLDGTLANCEHRRHFVDPEIELRPILSHPNYYAGSDGNIYSTKSSKGHLRKNPRILKPFIGNSGYQTIGLFLNKSSQNLMVHRLVCGAFHGNCPEGMECLHIDDDKFNNTPSNLKWGTRSQNLLMREKIRGGWAGGLKHGNQRFNKEQISEIKKLISEEIMGTEIAKKFGCHKSTIYEIKRGDTYR